MFVVDCCIHSVATQETSPFANTPEWGFFCLRVTVDGNECPSLRIWRCRNKGAKFKSNVLPGIPGSGHSTVTAVGTYKKSLPRYPWW